MEKKPPSHQPPLQFKPMSEGLGFHPFSDGLPYAPPRAKPSSMPTPASLARGSGAVAAGPQIPVIPTTLPPGITPRPRVKVPVAASARPIPQPTPAPPVAPLSRPGFVYLLKRVVAYSIDLVVNMGLCAMGLLAALRFLRLPPESLLGPQMVAMAAGFILAFHWALTTAEEIALRTTLGKRLMGLVIEGPVTAIFLRSFFFLLSVGFCGVGLIWALFHPERRCWHDVAAGLQPEEIAGL